MGRFSGRVAVTTKPSSLTEEAAVPLLRREQSAHHSDVEDLVLFAPRGATTSALSPTRFPISAIVRRSR